MKNLIVLLVIALTFVSCQLSVTPGSPASAASCPTPTTYGVTYDNNAVYAKGGVVDTNKYGAGQTVTVRDGNGIANPGYSFVGWDFTANAKKAQYSPGDQFVIASDVTLYAVWLNSGSGVAITDPVKGGSEDQQGSSSQ